MLDWATGIIESTGYAGVVFAMFLENLFPPIPSELVMLFSGASAAGGSMSLPLVILAGIAGSLLGLLPWYYAGTWYGQERLHVFAARHGRFLTLSGKDIDRADAWFVRHGKKAVFFGRFLPAVRTLIAVPAGIMGMPLRSFMVFACLGSALYDGAFAVFGYAAGGSAGWLRQAVDIGTYVTAAVVVSWYLYRVATFRESYSAAPEGEAASAPRNPSR